MPKFNAAFQKWFGRSKVVDEHGQPLVVWHSTKSEKPLHVFKMSFCGLGCHFGTELSALSRGAKTGARNILPVYLSIQSPLRMPDIDHWDRLENVSRRVSIALKLSAKDLRQWHEIISSWDTTTAYDAIRKILADLGYDGIVYKNEGEDVGHDSYIALYPEQIKSATGNDGTWDQDDPDIRSNPPKPRAHLIRYVHPEGWVAACGRKGPFQDATEDPQEFSRLWNRCRACQKELDHA